MRIPLQNRLKRRLHVEIALLQDEIMEILYGLEPSLILHGGTAVWRCYGGNRFSEDLDLYCAKISGLEGGLAKRLGERGLELLKFKKTENLIFGKVSDGNSEVRLEINFAKGVKPSLGRYEKADGTQMDVLTLSPEELLAEKAAAYGDRRFVRDIYDVYHLSGSADEGKVRPAILRLLSGLKEPVDEKNLKAIVYSGAVPTFRQMAEALRRRFP